MKTYWWLISLIIIGCNRQPEGIQYGHDACAHCRMIIADEKFGSELITQKGKIYKFDSIECLAAYLGQIPDNEIHSMWITDFKNPGKWIRTDEAQFLQSTNIPSPMGMFLSGYADVNDARSMQTQFDGDVLDWQQVKVRVESHHTNK
ncbi:nitrous oxide reductase accessory protein NosL [bacterium]|nr:nitrous oxide reductase accessory protein NosL [bacterium]